MELDLSEYMGAYIDGSRENLDMMDKMLLNLEQNPSNIEAVGEIFRAAHTLKGMSATMGFEKIAHLTHEMENLLDKLRNNQLAVTPPVIDLIFETFDILRTLVEDSINQTESTVDLQEISRKLAAMAEGNVPTVSAAVPSLGNTSSNTITTGSTGVDLGIFGLSDLEVSGLEGSKESGNHVVYLKVTLVADCLLKGPRVFMIMRALEECQTEIIKSVPDAKDLENEKFDRSFEMLLVTPQTSQDIKDAIDGISEVEKVETTEINPSNLGGTPTSASAPVATPIAQPQYSEPQTPVSAPQAPAYTAPQAPAYTAPQAPAYTAPQTPVYTAPQTPVYAAPQAPQPMYAPQAPIAQQGYAPQMPMYPQGPGMPQAYPGQIPMQQMYAQPAPGGMPPYGAPPMYIPPQQPYGATNIQQQPNYIQPQAITPVSVPTMPSGPAIIQPATPAQPTNQQETPEEEQEEEKEKEAFGKIITFTMAGEAYALEIDQIETIINLVNITRVPKAPSHIDGVINLRGEIIPVINTRRRLKLAEAEHTPSNEIIILSFEEEKVKVGLLVDSVQEVVSIPETAIEPPTRVSESVDIEYLRGVGKIDNKIVILLNANRIVFDKPKEE